MNGGVNILDSLTEADGKRLLAFQNDPEAFQRVLRELHDPVMRARVIDYLTQTCTTYDLNPHAWAALGIALCGGNVDRACIRSDTPLLLLGHVLMAAEAQR
jgi:hypothetical protein